MRAKSNFFKQQEQQVAFAQKNIVQEDDWAPVTVPRSVLNCIVRLGSPSITPVAVATESDQIVTVFARKSDLVGTPVAIGWIVTVSESEFTVTKVDDRGVLPSEYNCRIEAVRR